MSRRPNAHTRQLSGTLPTAQSARRSTPRSQPICLTVTGHWHARLVGRRPKWQLRKGDCLEADATRVMAHDKPLLLYRGFRPFRSDGNVLKASQIFSGAPDFNGSMRSMRCLRMVRRRRRDRCSRAASSVSNENVCARLSMTRSATIRMLAHQLIRTQAGLSIGWRSRRLKRGGSGQSGSRRQIASQ